MKMRQFVLLLALLAGPLSCSQAQAASDHIERPKGWPSHVDCDLVRKPYTWFLADGKGTTLEEARGIARLARRAMREQFGIDDGVLYRCREGSIPETKATRHRGDCEEPIGKFADVTPEAADKICSLEHPTGKRIHSCARDKALDECKRMTGKKCASLGTPYLIPSFKEEEGASCRSTVWAIDPSEFSEDEIDDEGYETFAFKPNFYGRKLKPYAPTEVPEKKKSAADIRKELYEKNTGTLGGFGKNEAQTGGDWGSDLETALAALKQPGGEPRATGLLGTIAAGSDPTPSDSAAGIVQHEDPKQKHIGIAVPGSPHAQLFEAYRAIETAKETCMAKKWGKRRLRAYEKDVIETECACDASGNGLKYREHADKIERLLKLFPTKYDYISVEFTDEQAPTPAGKAKRISYAVEAPRFYDEAVGIKHLWSRYHFLNGVCEQARTSSYLERRKSEAAAEKAKLKAIAPHKLATYRFIDKCLAQCTDDCKEEGCLDCEKDCVSAVDALSTCIDAEAWPCQPLYDVIKKGEAKLK